MINYLTKAVTKFFGTKSERDIKELMPIVENVKVEFAKLSSLTDNQLRQKTVDLKALIQERLAKYDAEISDFKSFNNQIALIININHGIHIR